MLNELEITRNRKVLIFASPIQPGKGITGAAIGTEVVSCFFVERFDVTRVSLRAHGFHAINSSIIRRIVSSSHAVLNSIRSIFEFCVVLRRKGSFEFVYFVPGASTLGILRNGLIVLLTKKCAPKAKIVMHSRNGNYFEDRNWILNAVMAYTHNKCSCFIVLSKHLLPVEIGQIGLEEKKVWVIPNTIDSELEPVSSNACLERKGCRISVLYFSNYIPEKGYIVLLKAIEKLCNLGLEDNFDFILRGSWISNESEKIAQELTKHLKLLGASVDLGGAVNDRPEAQQLYASADIFCLPTFYAAEAQPRSIIEAMANGCVVISTSYRGILDLVENQGNGLLIPAVTVDALTTAFIELMNSDLTSKKMRSLELYKEKFRREKVGEKLFKMMESID